MLFMFLFDEALGVIDQKSIRLHLKLRGQGSRSSFVHFAPQKLNNNKKHFLSSPGSDKGVIIYCESSFFDKVNAVGHDIFVSLTSFFVLLCRRPNVN